MPRFELGTSPTRTERATRLRHTPSAHRVPARRQGMFGERRGALDCGRGRQGRDRRLRERAARGRTLAGVRAARAAGGRRRRGDAAALWRLELARAVRARGRRRGATWCSSITGSSGATSRSSSTGASADASRRSSAANASLVAYHLALDAHETLGNAAQLAARIGADGGGPVRQLRARLHGRRPHGRRAGDPRRRRARARATRLRRRPRADRPPRRRDRAAGYDLIRAAHEGFDALLTGEPEEPNSPPPRSSASTCSPRRLQ